MVIFQLDPSAGKVFMGYVVAANPLAQMLCSPLMGWWGNRRGSVRLPLVVSLLVFTLASGAYSVLEALPSYRKYWMLMSRFFIGVSSGMFPFKQIKNILYTYNSITGMMYSKIL